MSRARVLNEVRHKRVEFIHLEFVDMDGRPKRVTVHSSLLRLVIEEGIGFDGSSVPSYAPIERSDLVLLPDLRTFKVIPRKQEGKRLAKVFCNVCYSDGTPHECDPRYVLDRELSLAQRRGYGFLVGSELEFYLFKPGPKPEPLDEGKYFDYPPLDKGGDFRLRFASRLQELGLEVEKIHHEVNPGQYELDVKFTDALTTADNIVTSRQMLQALAEEAGLRASYDPKPLPGAMGNGLHCHLSLVSSKTGRNLFFDPSDEYHMSKLARHFLAGLLDHARSLTALAASIPQSYQRLVPGFEAPVYVCWGGPNRSVMIRVPGFELRRGKGVRLEYRVPDPACNPYLLFAGLLSAGLDGIKRKLDPGPPVPENVYKMDAKRKEERKIRELPGSLDEALDELESDEVIKRALGEPALEAYVKKKRDEAATLSAL